MGTVKITLKRLQETTVDVEYDEVEYLDWLWGTEDTPKKQREFVRSHRHWGDDLDDLLDGVRESAWTTVDSGDEDGALY